MATVIDFFCGVGGFSYGFKNAGYELLLGIDYEDSKLKTYEKNIKCKTLLKDISTLTIDEIRKCTNNIPIDVIIGSPPCIDYTPCNPNKKSKKDQEANHFFPLVYNFFFMVASLSPKFFVLENVIPFYNTRDYYIIKNLFEMFGYSLYLNEINVEDFGVPQQRCRGFLIGTLLNNKIILSRPNNPKRITLEEAIGDLKTICPLTNYTLEKQELSVNYAYSDYQKLMHSKKTKLFIYNHTLPTHLTKTVEILQNLNSGNYYGKNRSHIRSFPSDISKPITSRFSTPSADGETMHYEFPRCLTLREAARIQSFNDDFIFIVNQLKKSEIGKLVGDAVPPLIAEQIANEIKELL